MKGIQGLVIAIVLGLIGAAVNWKYLSDESKQGKTVSLIMVAPDKKIKQGQLFRNEDLATFVVSTKQAGSLLRIAIKEEEKGGVVGQPATRDYEGYDIIFEQDMRTVPQGDLPLRPNEVAIWVPVDKSRFISQLIVPGKTQVYFRLPKLGPTPVGSAAESGTELVGPFDVLSVGNRRGTVDTMRSESVRPMQDNVLTIRATRTGKQLDDRATRLTSYLDKTNSRPLDVILEPVTNK